MKRYWLIIFPLVCLSCTGNIEKVRIHTQLWTSENLNVDEFLNGDPIPEAQTDEEWNKAAAEHKPAWCYYNNNPANGEIYGKLYNFYAATDKRGIAPEGWHVPSLDEWKILINNLGGAQIAGRVMKDSLTWEKGFNFNESGFSAKASGYRNPNHKFYLKGKAGGWWSTTSKSEDYAWAVYNASTTDCANTVAVSKSDGAPIRCIKN